MSDPLTGGSDDFNDGIIAELRANQGRVSGPLAGTPILLMHQIGARSGVERVTPVAYEPDGHGRFVIVASNGGSPTHPSWYHNLEANPMIEVEVGTETLTVVAEELQRDARAELWPKLIAAAPSVADYQTMTARQIPVLLLTRADRPASGATGAPRQHDDGG